jgi:hypothetical protein
MECLGNGAEMIGLRRGVWDRDASLGRASKTIGRPRQPIYRALRDGLLDLAIPGISCLDTIMRSLRDNSIPAGCWFAIAR